MSSRVIVLLAALGGAILLGASAAFASSAQAAQTRHSEREALAMSEVALKAPTILTASLFNGEASAASITVSTGTYVTATAALAGTDAADPHGTVSYAIYRDSACTNLVRRAGRRSVREDLESRPERLTPGTYYWQASYSGDELDAPASTACGSLVETVEGQSTRLPCNAVAGEASYSSSEGELRVKDRLFIDPSMRRRLVIRLGDRQRVRLTHLQQASCVARKDISSFRLRGGAKLDGTSGYTLLFAVKVWRDGNVKMRVELRTGKHQRILDLDVFATAGNELFS